MVKKDSSNKKKGFYPSKRKGHDDDDDSVDSKGNIRGLIDYDQDSDEDFSCPSSSDSVSEKSPIASRTRNQLQRQQRKKNGKSPKKRSRKNSVGDSSDETTPKNNKKNSTKPKRDVVTSRKRSRWPVIDSDESEDDDKDNFDDTTEEEMSEEETSEEEVESTEETSEDESEDEGEVEESDSDSDSQDSDDKKAKDKTRSPGIILSFGMDGGDLDPLQPKRHNMKKEPEDVKKFVKLLTTPSDEDTIDGQIDQFKALSIDQQKKLIDVLENRHKSPSEKQSLMFKILTMNLPIETQSLVLGKYKALQSLDPGSSEYYKNRNWLDKLVSLPLGIQKDLPVKIGDGPETCGAFMEKARKYLDDAIQAQEEAKLQILQFIGSKIANPSGQGVSLLLAGPPGIGKTSLIKNGIAKALQWPFQFISLGGDSDASTQVGHQLVQEGSHCGKIVNSLIAAKSMSLVMMFDEVDKISSTPKGEEVQNLLVHLTDPVQNADFEDKYLSGIPIDLSRVMFTFSANQLERMDRVLLDRMTVVSLQGQNLKDKVAIAENYLLPNALAEVGLVEKVGINREILHQICEEYANEEKGVRELKRCLEQIVQKVNMLRLFNSPTLPFHIKEFGLPFIMKKDHVDLFLKKKTKEIDPSIARMQI